MQSMRALLQEYYDRVPPDEPRLVPAHWSTCEGEGETVALIDGAPATDVEDLRGAALATIYMLPGAGDRSCQHTTHAACLLIGQGAVATRGIAPRARLLAFSVVGRDGEIVPSAIADAIARALAQGASILALPLGDHAEHSEIAAAVAVALARGVTIVAAAGNAHPRPILFPARLPGVLAVGAVDADDRLLADCCRGPGLAALAPGLRITAQVAPGRVAPRSGSSVATALVAGALALTRSSSM